MDTARKRLSSLRMSELREGESVSMDFYALYYYYFSLLSLPLFLRSCIDSCVSSWPSGRGILDRLKSSMSNFPNNLLCSSCRSNFRCGSDLLFLSFISMCVSINVLTKYSPPNINVINGRPAVNKGFAFFGLGPLPVVELDLMCQAFLVKVLNLLPNMIWLRTLQT